MTGNRLGIRQPVRRFYLLRAVGSFANNLLEFAVPILVYQTTKSVLWSGIALATEWLPRLISLPLAGVFVDRLHVRRVYAVSDAVRGVTACLVAATTIFAPEGLRLAALMALAVVAGACFEQTFVAGEKAVRLLVPLEKIGSAHSVLGAIDQTCELAGPALGALLLFAGTTPTVMTVGILFLISLCLAWGLPELSDAESQEREDAVEECPVLRGVLAQLLTSGRTALGHPVLRTVIMITFGVNLLIGMVMSASPALVERTFDVSSSGLGVMYASAGAVSIVLLAGVAAAMRRFGLLRVGMGSALATCGAFGLLGVAPNMAAYGLLVVAMFACQSVFTVFIRVVRAHVIPPEKFAGVVSVILLMNFASLPLAGILLALSDSLMSVTQLVQVTGVGVFLVVGVLLHRLAGLMPQERQAGGRWVVPVLEHAQSAAA